MNTSGTREGVCHIPSNGLVYAALPKVLRFAGRSSANRFTSQGFMWISYCGSALRANPNPICLRIAMLTTAPGATAPFIISRASALLSKESVAGPRVFRRILPVEFGFRGPGVKYSEFRRA